MVHIFPSMPAGLVFEIVNPFSWIFNAISSDKSCLISTWRQDDCQDTRNFPACWILIGQFKFPARQPYARLNLQQMSSISTLHCRQLCFKLTDPLVCPWRLGPSALSLEEQRLLQSLDRLNERLKGMSYEVQYKSWVVDLTCWVVDLNCIFCVLCREFMSIRD